MVNIIDLYGINMDNIQITKEQLEKLIEEAVNVVDSYCPNNDSVCPVSVYDLKSVLIELGYFNNYGKIC